MRSPTRLAALARLSAERAGPDGRTRRLPPAGRRRLPGWLRSLLVLGVGIAAALTVATPGNAQIGPDAAATRTIQALAVGDLSAVPEDFPQVMNYTPGTARLADGSLRVINPNGSCSVPGEGRPFDFAVACQAHDFGYDMLRYAQRRGAPLDPAARADIDLLLDHDLRLQCAADSTPASCDATVALFAAGVGFNSWRQVSGPPVDTSGLPRTAGLVLLALAGGGCLVTARSRLRPARPGRRRRLRPFRRPGASAG
ncbi:phospholipase A2 [Catellatospora sichuanensis]|uniref:phospholipase A2 n=1 Tax=Catellatospora sichuanensis TaxID=1969805 RepID=UPI001182F5A8|nr:phospholipase A2 [Catellatospora sichuanensis]